MGLMKTCKLNQILSMLAEPAASTHGDAVAAAEARQRQDSSFAGHVSNWLDSVFGFDTNPNHPANARPPSPIRAPGPGSNAPAPDGPTLFFMACRHAPPNESWLPQDEARRQRCTDPIHASVPRVTYLMQHRPEKRHESWHYARHTP